MPVTITLSTVPGHMTRERGYTTTTIDLFGPSLGSETLTAVSTVADVKAAVARFGGKLKAENPDASFYVSVRLAKGCRKPNGYDTAGRRNGFGQDDFMRVDDGRTVQPSVQVEGAAPPKAAA